MKKTPKGNCPLNFKDLAEANNYLYNTNKVLKRTFPTRNEYVNNLLRRNWFQVKNSECIYAISSITNDKVDGGTGWAVHMAILVNKPVFVFDQIQCKWFKPYYNSFIECNVPTLTKEFAGIGTREINKNGIKAIRDVYENTINFLKDGYN